MSKSRKLNMISYLVLAVFFLMPVFAFGADTTSAIHTEKDVSLSIRYQDKDQPLINAVFQMYQVTTLDKQGNHIVTDAFADYPVDLKSNDSKVWKMLADTLEGLIAVDSQQIPVATGKTDLNGNLVFGKEKQLKPGLYLVTGERHVQNGRSYYAKPFLVQLPMQISAAEWEYHISVNSKMESFPLPGGGESSQTSRKVLKVWEDEGRETERPESITIDLLCDGEVFDTVTLTEDINWRYEWSALSLGHRWMVVERAGEKYNVQVSQEGITFVVTNTVKEPVPGEDKPGDDPPSGEKIPEVPVPGGPAEPSDEEIIIPGIPLGDKLPQTGQLWWPVAVLISAGMIFIIIGLILRRGEYYGAE